MSLQVDYILQVSDHKICGMAAKYVRLYRTKKGRVHDKKLCNVTCDLNIGQSLQ